jgi:large subunit ribosomal protein L32
MPNPKRRFSKTRTASRRSTKVALAPTVSTDSATGQTHLRHRAHWDGDKLFYMGRVVVDKTAAE